MTGIAVHEHQPRVGEHAGERIEREHMFGRFQDPASRRGARALKVTQKPLEEPVALVVAGPIKPGAVGWRAIDVVIARAAEHLAREFDTLLGRIRLDWVEVSDPRRESVEDLELQLDLSSPRAELGRAMFGMGIDRLPNAGGAVGRILRHESMQERRAAARQAGNEDWRREWPPQDRLILALCVGEDQKRREHPLQVPARRKTPEGREPRLLTKTGSQSGKRLDKVGVRERFGVEARRFRCLGEQTLRRQSSLIFSGNRAREPVHCPG